MWIYAVVVVLVVVWLLVRSIRSSSSGVVRMSGGEFQTAIAAHPGAVVIDVRTPREFASGHMKGAKNLDIQGKGFTEAVAKLDPAGTYFVYCRSGARSSAAVSVMQKHGIMNLYELGGGAVGAPSLMTSR